MALIKCPECNKEISDKADACPSCGYSVEAAARRAGNVQTIEQTSKQWKQAQLIGVALAIIGIIMAVSGNIYGGFALFLGIALFIGARIGAWWENG